MGMIFIGLFIIPLSITLSELIFSENYDIKSLLTVLCIAFTFNWFADKTIIQWCINKGQKLTKKEKKKLITKYIKNSS